MRQNKASPAPKSAKRELDRTNKRPKTASSKLVPVHISVNEVIGFNSLQATDENPSGQYVDQKSGLREYSRLSNVLRIPKIRDLFVQTSELMFSGDPIPPEIEEIQKQPMPGEEEGLIPIPSDEDPSVQKVAEAGTGQDKILVMMPQDVVHFLDVLQGGENKDPKYGLQQFGFFDFILKPIQSVVRVAATVVGGAIGFAAGGPAGAAAGAYAGNMLGRGVTGQKMFGGNNPAWKAAMPNALYGGAAGLGLNWAGYGASTAATAAPIVNGVASTAPGVTTAATPYAAKAAATLAPSVVAPAATAAAPSMMGSLMSSPYLLPGALLGGGYMLSQQGGKQQKEQIKENKREHAERIKAHAAFGNQGLDGQMYSQPKMSERIRTGYNTGPYRDEEDDYGRTSRNPRYFKKGGLVKMMSVKGVPLKGPGKGQEDLIHKSIPEYTWIHDAHTVSALGDGTTEAGHKEIHKFEKKIKDEMLPLYKDTLIRQLKENKPRKVPCAVANGEHETPLLLVGALGKGSFEKGAKVLRNMTREIRQHKTSKKHDLPAAAHELSVYYKKALGGK